VQKQPKILIQGLIRHYVSGSVKKKKKLKLKKNNYGKEK
jgi:hypothetical protein